MVYYIPVSIKHVKNKYMRKYVWFWNLYFAVYKSHNIIHNGPLPFVILHASDENTSQPDEDPRASSSSHSTRNWGQFSTVTKFTGSIHGGKSVQLNVLKAISNK